MVMPSMAAIAAAQRVLLRSACWTFLRRCNKIPERTLTVETYENSYRPRLVASLQRG
jgi:hypothetical protein